MALNIDPSLVEAARSERTALDRLIAAVWPDAFRIAFGVLHDRGLAEDAAQEACAAMAESLGSLKRAEAFRAWFCRLVVNESISSARRRRDTVALTDESHAWPVSRDCGDAIDLAAAIAALPYEQRAAIVLHYFIGLNSREIALAANLPASTVRFHLMKARNALRRALSWSTSPSSSEAVSNAH